MGNIIDKLVSLVDEFDLAAVFPELDSVIGWAVTIARIFVLAAPLTMLILGLRYRYLPPKEANYETGYRFLFGMNSPRAWQYTQQLAGGIWTLLGGGMLVVVLILSLFFGGMEPMNMASTALWCVGLELVLIVVSCIMINHNVKKKFDKDGNLR